MFTQRALSLSLTIKNRFRFSNATNIFRTRQDTYTYTALYTICSLCFCEALPWLINFEWWFAIRFRQRFLHDVSLSQGKATQRKQDKLKLIKLIRLLFTRSLLFWLFSKNLPIENESNNQEHPPDQPSDVSNSKWLKKNDSVWFVETASIQNQITK